MLTRKQLDGWNNGDEREIRHTTPGSPRFLICTSVVNGGPRNGEPGPSKQLHASASRSEH